MIMNTLIFYIVEKDGKIRGLSGGQINGETVLDKNGRPLPYNKIGELEDTFNVEDKTRRKNRSKR